MAEGYDRVRLVPTVGWARDADSVTFVRGAAVVRVRGRVDAVAALAELLVAGTTVDALGERVGRPNAEALVRRLDAEGWLTAEAPSAAPGLAWERQVGYLTMFGPDAAAMQARLGASSVAVVGVGGIGALVAQHLVAAGVGEMHLVDFDVVASHNLNRQYLFTAHDVGVPKVEAARAALARLSGAVRLHTWSRAVAAPADLDDLPEGVDLLVVAADTPPGIDRICGRWAATRGVATTSAAVGLTSGYWGPLLDPGRGHCAECFHRGRRAALTEDEQRIEDLFAAPTPWSFGPSNSAVAALAAYDACRFLATGTCATLGRRGVLGFDPHRTTYVEPPAGARCDAHEGVPVPGGTGEEPR